MKTKTQPTITIEQIIQTIDSNPLQIEASREILYKSVGAMLIFIGTAESLTFLSNTPSHLRSHISVAPKSPHEYALLGIYAREW